MPNRLALQTSPYLRQHEDDPIDWFPWGDEAFARAAAEEKPLFISIGYSACHWCHVMAHESFQDRAVSEVLNRGFICIKVDREEHPDVDEAYMAAVQLTNGHGGWPMSVFATPDRRPFFAATYLPKDDRGEAPGFLSVTRQIEDLWRNRRADVVAAAEQLADALGKTLGASAPSTFDRLGQDTIDEAVAALRADFDPNHGGFGRAPKFPPHSAIEFLMEYAVSAGAKEELRQPALAMAVHTLERMASGGIHDQVGGGFHRYSTDERWFLPHFEKMLYDNALCLGNYARAAGLLQDLDPALSERFLRVAERLVQWAHREMVSPEGLFYSALDADSEGEEGRFYTWSIESLAEAMADPAGFAAAFGFDPEGNYLDEATRQRTGLNLPFVAGDPAGDWDAELEALRVVRDGRPRPGLDDKCLVGWNGLMIGALAEAGAIDLAVPAAVAILDAEAAYGRLPRQVTHGIPLGEAFLEDYAYFADGLMRLSTFVRFAEDNPDLGLSPAGVTAEFLADEAARLANEMNERFHDPAGAFFATSNRHETLFGRTKPVFDQPMPSGNSVAIRLLAALGRRDQARADVESLLGWMRRAPQATEALHLVAMSLIEPIPASAPSVPPATVPVRVDLAERRILAPEGRARATVVLEIAPGFHLNSSRPPARWLVPTRVEAGPIAARIDYPPATDDRYEGRIEIGVDFELPAGESGADFEIVVTYQPCTESECLLAQEVRLGGMVTR